MWATSKKADFKLAWATSKKADSQGFARATSQEGGLKKVDSKDRTDNGTRFEASRVELWDAHLRVPWALPLQNGL